MKLSRVTYSFWRSPVKLSRSKLWMIVQPLQPTFLYPLKTSQVALTTAENRKKCQVMLLIVHNVLIQKFHNEVLVYIGKATAACHL